MNRQVKDSTRGTMLFSQVRGETVNQLVKDSVNGTELTVLFSQERARPKIIQSNIPLTVRTVECCFQRNNKTKNHRIKSSVNGTSVERYFPSKE